MEDFMNDKKENQIDAVAEPKTDKLKAIGDFMCPAARVGKWYVYFSILMIAVAVVATAAVIYFICGPMEGYLHSDYTDTIYWADATYTSGKIINPDFKYAALLPFSANLWFIPLIAMFGVSMTAQVIGMVIFALLLVAALYFMCRSFKWSIPWTAFTIAAFLMIMSSSDKLREIMWGHVIYYSLILLILFFGMGAVVRYSEMKLSVNAKSIVIGALIFIFFSLVATNGFQITAMSTVPIGGALFAERFFDKEKKLLDRDNAKTFGIVGGLLLSVAVGSVLLSAIKGDIVANYAEGQSNISPVSTWIDHLLAFPEDWFSLLGFGNSSALPLLKGSTLIMMVNMLTAIVILIMPLVLLFNYKKISDKGTRLVLWMHVIVTAVTMFGWICGYLSTANWRLTSMAGTSVIATVAAIRFLALQRSESKTPITARIASVMIILLALTTAVNFNTIRKMPTNYGDSNTLHYLTSKLEEEGLEYGYATFWRSQAITLLSDSEIKVRMVLADSSRGVWTDYYQNCYSWYEDQEGVDRYFVLLSRAERNSALQCKEWKDFIIEQDPETIELEGYVLYIFEENLNFD